MPHCLPEDSRLADIVEFGAGFVCRVVVCSGHSYCCYSQGSHKLFRASDAQHEYHAAHPAATLPPTALAPLK